MGCLNSTPAKDPVPVAVREPSKKPTTSADYERVKILGMGASCNVMIAENKRTKKQFALKVLRKAGHDAADSKRLFDNEVRILQTLRHPNIIEFVEAFEEDASCTIVTGLCRGGELFDRISQGSITERVASALTRQLLLALAHCHERNISHRDIKPENLIYETPAEDSNAKLIDFGCALLSPDDEIVKDVAGSPYYVAPEVLDHSAKRTGRTWKAADMWSVGVMVFLLVHGYPPFNGEKQEQIFQRIRKAKFKYSKTINISDACKDLINKLLVREPSQRISAADALNHPWITAPERLPNIPLSAEVVRGLGEFRSACKLRKAVARATHNLLTEDDKAALAEIFKKYDLNGDGKLDADEISAMMKDLGRQPAEIKQWMEDADDNKDGTISQEEFLTAAVAARVPSQEEVKKSFDMFDVDGDGFVTHEEIEKMCSGMSPDVAKQLIADVDQNGDGRINFNEWLSAMQQQQGKK